MHTDAEDGRKKAQYAQKELGMNTDKPGVVFIRVLPTTNYQLPIANY